MERTQTPAPAFIFFLETKTEEKANYIRSLRFSYAIKSIANSNKAISSKSTQLLSRPQGLALESSYLEKPSWLAQHLQARDRRYLDARTTLHPFATLLAKLHSKNIPFRLYSMPMGENGSKARARLLKGLIRTNEMRHVNGMVVYAIVQSTVPPALELGEEGGVWMVRHDLRVPSRERISVELHPEMAVGCIEKAVEEALKWEGVENYGLELEGAVSVPMLMPMPMPEPGLQSHGGPYENDTAEKEVQLPALRERDWSDEDEEEWELPEFIMWGGEKIMMEHDCASESVSESDSDSVVIITERPSLGASEHLLQR
jgi:hypothetical protein